MNIHARPSFPKRGLGVAPLVIAAGGAAAGTAATVGAKAAWDWGSNWWSPFAQWIGIEQTPSLPVNTAMPQFREPLAPQTEAMMKSPTLWGDTGYLESLAQQRDAVLRSTEFQRQAMGVDPTAPLPPGPDQSSGVTPWLVYGGLGLLTLVLIARR